VCSRKEWVICDSVYVKMSSKSPRVSGFTTCDKPSNWSFNLLRLIRRHLRGIGDHIFQLSGQLTWRACALWVAAPIQQAISTIREDWAAMLSPHAPRFPAVKSHLPNVQRQHEVAVGHVEGLVFVEKLHVPVSQGSYGGIGVGPIGSVQLSLITLPMDNSRFFIRPALVFISSIFTRTFLLVKLNLCKGLPLN
jgi:hypothetical protein